MFCSKLNIGDFRNVALNKWSYKSRMIKVE